MIQRVPVWRDDADPLRLELLVAVRVFSGISEFPVDARVRWWNGSTFAEQGTVRKNDGSSTILVQVDVGADATVPNILEDGLVNEEQNFATAATRVEAVARDLTIAPGDFVVIEGYDGATSVATPLPEAPFHLELLADVTGGAATGVYFALIGSGETPRLRIPLPSVVDANPVPVIGAAFERVDALLDANRTRTVHATIPDPGAAGLTPLMLRHPRTWRLRRVTAVLDQGAGDLGIYTVEGEGPFEGDFIELYGPSSPPPFGAFAVTDALASWGDLDGPPSPTGALWVELTDVSGDPTSLLVTVEIEEEAP